MMPQSRPKTTSSSGFYTRFSFFIVVCFLPRLRFYDGSDRFYKTGGEFVVTTHDGRVLKLSFLAENISHPSSLLS
jgi:hypothetical protein